MNDAIIIALVMVAILSAISFIDAHFTFFAGLAWVWVGSAELVAFHPAYLLMALGVGMLFIFKGVWTYVPEK